MADPYLLEVWDRVQDRLWREGWPEGMELAEAVASDPEYAAAVRRSLPPRRRGNAEVQTDRKRRADAWANRILNTE